MYIVNEHFFKHSLLLNLNFLNKKVSKIFNSEKHNPSKTNFAQEKVSRFR